MNIKTLSDIRELIASKEKFDVSQSFDLSKVCVAFLKNREKEHLGRELAIRVLDNYMKFPVATNELWNDIVEMSGLYPYLNPALLSPSALLRYEFHKSKNLQDIYLHEEQQEIASQLQSGNSVILSAPTSFGKSLIIEELIASKKYKNLVVIQPTLALLDETRKKLSKYKDSYNLIVSTTQKAKPETGNVFLFTGERVVEYTFENVDFFVIDEFYKLSLGRDDERAITLNHAFHKLLKFTNRFYLLGPVIKSIPVGFREKLNIGIRYTNFATVAVDEIGLVAPKNETKEEKQFRLYSLLSSLNEPTLIYCSAPEKAVKVAAGFSRYLGANGQPNLFLERNKDINEWIEENINEKWTLTECLSNGVAFHTGILPRHLGSSIVDAFNSGGIKYLFCTSTLIEGVNTSAKNIVLFDNTKGNRVPIDFFDYKNIAGRSGRMKVHYTGRVFKFYDTPPQLELELDIPFLTQTNAPVELLIQLDREELTAESREKLQKYDDVDEDLMNIIKSNSGIGIEAQLSLVGEIERRLRHYNRNISWSGYPNYYELLPVVELAWKFLLRKNESKANVRSPAQLTAYVIQYSIYKNVGGVIANQVNSAYWLKELPDEQARIDRVTFNVLNALRHWFDYKLPKFLTTISKLQEYVFRKHGLRSGDYTAFASAVENGFLTSVLTTLLEYDIPMSAIRKLEKSFDRNDSFEDIYSKLGELNLEDSKLNKYEIRKIKQIL